MPSAHLGGCIVNHDCSKMIGRHEFYEWTWRRRWWTTGSGKLDHLPVIGIINIEATAWVCVVFPHWSCVDDGGVGSFDGGGVGDESGVVSSIGQMRVAKYNSSYNQDP